MEMAPLCPFDGQLQTSHDPTYWYLLYTYTLHTVLLEILTLACTSLR